MMFMMPMPPTNRLTAATAPSSMVSTLGGARQCVGQLLGVKHIEVVFVGRAELAQLAQQLALTRVLSLPSVMDTSTSLTWVLPVMRALQGLDRHENQVVLVAAAERSLSFGAEHSDDLAADVLHPKRFTQCGDTPTIRCGSSRRSCTEPARVHRW